MSIRAAEHQLEVEFRRRREELRRKHARETAHIALQVWAEVELGTKTSRVRPEGWGTDERPEGVSDDQGATWSYVWAVLAANNLSGDLLRGLLVHVFGRGGAPAEFRPVVRTIRQRTVMVDEIDLDGTPTGKQVPREEAEEVHQPLCVPMEMRALGWTMERLLDGAYKHAVATLQATILRDGWELPTEGRE